MLKSGDVGPEIDVFKKESYLSDATFSKVSNQQWASCLWQSQRQNFSYVCLRALCKLVQVIGMPKDEFYKMPKWKRDRKKRDSGLF